MVRYKKGDNTMKTKKAFAAVLGVAMALGACMPAFAENEKAVTRGQAIERLWITEGEPVVNYIMPFDDVDGDITEAVRWAASERLISGVGGGKFEPETGITREQTAAVLYRYAQYKGYDVTGGENTNILSYNDAFDISEYAVGAVQWACAEGILTDKDGNIEPAGKVSENEAYRMIEMTAVNQKPQTVVNMENENISLIYKGGYDFVLNSADKQTEFEMNCLVNDSYKPEITLADLNGDGTDEICITAVTGAGSGFHTETVFVFDGSSLEELIVPEAYEIADSVISFDEQENKYTITADKKTYEINDLGSYGKLVFTDLKEYEIKDGKLYAKLQLQNAPDAILGELCIEYKAVEGGFGIERITYTENI